MSFGPSVVGVITFFYDTKNNNWARWGKAE